MRIKIRRFLKRLTGLFEKEEPWITDFKFMINSNDK